jgi:hypothetical protein
MASNVLAILAFVVVAVAGFWLVRRRVPLEVLQEHHEVAGIAFAVLGGLYGIILAFVLVASWERFEAARANVELEANALGDLHFHADGYDEPTRSQLRGAVMDYLHSVLADEWKTMRDGEPSDATRQLYYAAWNSVLTSRPSQSWEVALYQSTLQKLDDLGDARRHRLLYVHTGLPPILWYFLVVFGAVTIAFTYFFGMRNARAQAMITVALAATIACTLMLIDETQTPFAGAMRVSSRPYRLVEKMIQLERPNEEARKP